MRFTVRQKRALDYIKSHGGNIQVLPCGVFCTNGRGQLEMQTSEDYAEFLQKYCTRFTPQETEAQRARIQRHLARLKRWTLAAMEQGKFFTAAKLAKALAYADDSAREERNIRYYHVTGVN